MTELRNGALVTEIRRRIEQAVDAGEPLPGRRALAADLEVTEYAARQALTEITRAPTPAPPASPAPVTSRPRRRRPTMLGTRRTLSGRPRAPRMTRQADSRAVSPRPVGDAEPVVLARGRGRVARWPLLLLALPAFVAIWGGWVGLGELAGFGVIRLLPGIWDSLQINSAVTLPIGLETYAAYALHVALSGRAPAGRARMFAGWSAVASLVLGAAGQIAYHLMTAAGLTTAPWLVTAAVATLPVVVLGMGAALAHLITHPGDDDSSRRKGVELAAG